MVLFPLSVTPECFYQGSKTIKGRPLYQPPKRQQPTLKKQKTQKTTEDEENIFLSGFPTKDFRNDGGGGFPECLYHPQVPHS